MSYDILKDFLTRLKVINASSKNLTSMTKTEIKEFGASVGVSLNLSSSKANMISTLEASEEFELSEVQRKNSEMVAMSKEVYGI